MEKLGCAICAPLGQLVNFAHFCVADRDCTISEIAQNIGFASVARWPAVCNSHQMWCPRPKQNNPEQI